MRKDFYDSAEVGNPDLREGGLFGQLPNLIALALSGTGWARQLNGVDPNSVTSREALAHVPLLRADDWPALRGNDPPFGGFALSQRGRTRRVLMSPGPVFHPDIEGKDWCGAARALFAAGMRPGDVVLNCFSYHLSPFGFLMDSGAQALGCTVIAAGSDDAIAVAEVMRTLGAARLCRPGGIPQADFRRGRRQPWRGDDQARAGGRRAADAGHAPRVRRRRDFSAGMPGASRRRHHRL